MKGTIRTRELEHGEVASPFDEILENINWGIKAGIKKANKKPLDGLLNSIEGVDMATDRYIDKLKQDNKDLLQENFDIKDEIVMLKDLLTPEQEWIFKRQMEDKENGK